MNNHTPDTIVGGHLPTRKRPASLGWFVRRTGSSFVDLTFGTPDHGTLSLSVFPDGEVHVTGPRQAPFLAPVVTRPSVARWSRRLADFLGTAPATTRALIGLAADLARARSRIRTAGAPGGAFSGSAAKSATGGC